MKLTTFILLAHGLIAMAAIGGTIAVENNRLSVSYDSAVHRFAVTDRATHQRALVEGLLLEAPVARAQVLAAHDAVFGKGRQIRVTYADGAVSALEIYPDLPFLLIKTDFRNSGTTETDLVRVVPVRFTVDLGKPASELRTLGTAGLTAADKNPGRYLFLPVPSPATTQGVVPC